MESKTSRALDPKEALEILKDFYLEVKKEIKKSEHTRIKIEDESDTTGSLHFFCDGFNLSFIVREGGAA